MPELPEVETVRRKIEKALKGKKIIKASVTPDDIVFKKKSPSSIKKAFIHAKVKKVGRKGKYFWMELDKKPWALFHLGMSGSVVIADELPTTKMRSIKVILEAEDGTIMIFRDPRRFGRLIFLDDPENEKPLSLLGPDVMNELPSVAKLTSLLEKRKAPIKAVLLDQSTLSGIGNWMADEILFQAGIDPARPSSSLKRAEFKKLHDKIKFVTSFAVKHSADYDLYPKSWLFHHRWGRKKGSVSTGDAIKHTVVGGRSTAWVPAKQK